MKKIIFVMLIILLAVSLITACKNEPKDGWEIKIEDAGGYSNDLSALEEENGYIYVGGKGVSGPDAPTYDFMVSKIDSSNGAVVWTKYIDGDEEQDTVQDLYIYNDAIYLVGYEYPNDLSDYNWIIAKIKTSDGSAYDANWETPKKIDSTFGNDKAFAILADDDGVYITGIYKVDNGDDTSHSEYGVVKLTHDGDIDSTWSEVKTFRNATESSDEPQGMTMDNDQLYIVGTSENMGNSPWLLSVNKDNGTEGTLNVLYPDTTVNLTSALAIDYSSDNLYLACTSLGDNMTDWYIMKVSATDGSIDASWGESIIFSTENVDIPKDIRVDGDFVYTIGYKDYYPLEPYESPSIWLLKLNEADGTEAVDWEGGKTYNPSNDDDKGLALDFDGTSLYIAGTYDNKPDPDPQQYEYDWWIKKLTK